MNEYLSPEQVCDLLPGMTKSALAQLRFTGKGPAYRAPTPKRILYKRQDVIDWIESSSRTQTGVAVSA